MNLNLSGEDRIHSDLIQWARKMEKDAPELALLFHVPNGGGRSAAQGMKLKALGVRPGVPDLCLPVMRGKHGALWLEIKDGDKGKLSKEQVLWAAALTKEGHCCRVVRSFEEGKGLIEWYLGL